jgi:hypothetical protein
VLRAEFGPLYRAHHQSIVELEQLGKYLSTFPLTDTKLSKELVAIMKEVLRDSQTDPIKNLVPLLKFVWREKSLQLDTSLSRLRRSNCYKPDRNTYLAITKHLLECLPQLCRLIDDGSITSIGLVKPVYSFNLRAGSETIMPETHITITLGAQYKAQNKSHGKDCSAAVKFQEACRLPHVSEWRQPNKRLSDSVLYVCAWGPGRKQYLPGREQYYLPRPKRYLGSEVGPNFFALLDAMRHQGTGIFAGISNA